MSLPLTHRSPEPTKLVPHPSLSPVLPAPMCLLFPNCYTPGSWPPSSIEINQRPDNRNKSNFLKEIEARLYWGSWFSRGDREQMTVSLLAHSPRWWDELVPSMGCVEGCSQGSVGGWLRGLAEPSSVVCWGHVRHPAFALGS